MENFFATCTFCGKSNQLVVFEVSWKSQETHDNRWVKGDNVWLCVGCCSKYRLEHNNHDYDLKVKEMNELLDNCYSSGIISCDMIRKNQIYDKVTCKKTPNLRVKQEVIIIK